MSETKVSESRIPDFIGFCMSKQWELPFAVPEENGARTGAKEGLYPSLYWSGRYPPGYKTPVAADSAYYQSINKK
jgi:hypothetical protein